MSVGAEKNRNVFIFHKIFQECTKYVLFLFLYFSQCRAIHSCRQMIHSICYTFIHFALILFFFLNQTGQLLLVQAFTCEVGRERNQHNEWMWVLPYPNPCECTSVIMGGLNTWTPIRPFVPVYAKTPLLSDDINTIREHYKLQCDEESKYYDINLKP